MRIEADYPVSMTGVHGAGKKTLRDRLCALHADYVPVEYKLLKLGRMVDQAGLNAFRERMLEQDRLVDAVLEAGQHPVTSRLGVLDVAIIAAVMAKFGRIEASVTGAYLERLERDLADLFMPRALIAVWAPAEVLQNRLQERDRDKDVKPSRGAAKMAGLIAFTKEIFVEGHYPHPLIERIVERYRHEGRLLLLDTGHVDSAAACECAVDFLAARGLSVQPAGREER